VPNAILCWEDIQWNAFQSKPLAAASDSKKKIVSNSFQVQFFFRNLSHVLTLISGNVRHRLRAIVDYDHQV
jgi:hypothetical protein